MEWQGGINKGPTTGNGVGASSLEIWKFFQVGYPVDMYLSPNWMLSRVQSVKHFFLRNALSRAHRGVLVPTSLWLGPIRRFIAICHCHFLASFFFFLKAKHAKKTPLSTFHCNQLQHTHLACFKTDLPDYFRFSFVQVITDWAMRVSYLVVTSQRSRDRNVGFSAADDAAARSIMFVFIQINTFTYLRKMSIYQTNSVYVKLYLYSTM